MNVLFPIISAIGCLRCCLFHRVFCGFCIPAGGSVPGDYLTQASVQAVIGLHLAGALAGQTPHDAVARITQTLRLIRPAVHHAAGELVARQELARVRLVGWGRRENDNESVSSSLQARVTGEPEPEPHLAPLPKTDCRSQCRAAWRRHCRSPPAHSGRPWWRYTAPACPASSCCSPPRCRSGNWGFPAAWSRSDWTADTAEAAESEKESRSDFPSSGGSYLTFSVQLKKKKKKKQTGGVQKHGVYGGREVSTWVMRLMKCCCCQSERPASPREERVRRKIWPSRWYWGRCSTSKCGFYTFFMTFLET